MNYEKELMNLINQCPDREQAVLVSLEVIRVELERLLSEPASQLSGHPAKDETTE